MEKERDFVHIDKEGKPLSPDESAEAKLSADRAALIEDLEALPEDREGLNINRVESFIRGLGLEIKPMLVLNKEHLGELQAVYVKNGEKSLAKCIAAVKDGKIDRRGQYEALSDRVLIIRDPQLEAENGAEYTEAIIVHELAHASNSYFTERYTKRGLLRKKVNSRPARVGLRLASDSRDKGFLEEGWACLIQMKYAREVLGARGGFGDGKPLFWGEDLPPEYYYTKNGKRWEIPYAHLAYAMQLLTEREPRLFDAMKRARTDTEGLRDVAKLIEGIRPGLYKQLRHYHTVIYSERQLDEVQKALGEKPVGSSR